MKFSQRPLTHVSLYLLSVLNLLTTFLISPAKIYPQTSVVIAVEDDAAPWSRSDGQGYVNDLVVSAFKAVGVDVELKVVPYARCKRMAVNGEVAGCFSMSPSDEFNGLIELSEKPLFTVTSGYFYNVHKPLAAKRQEDLPAKTIVGTVLGYEYPSAFEQLKQAGIVVVDESPSENTNLQKLAAGRIDLALVTYDDMKLEAALIQRAGVTGRVKLGFLAGTMKSYIGFSTNYVHGGWAKQQFDRGFASITKNGTLRRIRTTWLRRLEQ